MATKSQPKKSAAGLADEIAAGVGFGRGTAWHQMLPPDVLGEVIELRRRFQAGELRAGPTAVARSLIAALSARGYSMPGNKTVREWLHDQN